MLFASFPLSMVLITYPAACFSTSALIFAFSASPASSAEDAVGPVTSVEFGGCGGAGWSAYGKLVRGSSWGREHLPSRVRVRVSGQGQGSRLGPGSESGSGSAVRGEGFRCRG